MGKAEKLQEEGVSYTQILTIASQFGMFVYASFVEKFKKYKTLP